MAKFLKSAFADEYNKEFDKQLEVLTTKGFTHIEPRGIDGTFLAKLEDDKVKEVKAKLQNAGIGISAMGSFLGKYEITEPLAPHLEIAKRIYDISAGFTHFVLAEIKPRMTENLLGQWKPQRH